MSSFLLGIAGWLLFTDVVEARFMRGIEKFAVVPADPGDTSKYPPPPAAGLDTRLAPAKDGLLARMLACCSCCTLVRSVAVEVEGLMMKKGCWTIGILLAGMRYTGPQPVLPMFIGRKRREREERGRKKERERKRGREKTENTVKVVNNMTSLCMVKVVIHTLTLTCC
jgi:hypothetical protein